MLPENERPCQKLSLRGRAPVNFLKLAGTLAAPVRNGVSQNNLERVARPDLEYARLALNLDQVRPVRRWVKPAQRWIAYNAKSAPANVHQSETLEICNVEHIPTDLKLMFLAPRHIKRLRQSQVDVHVTDRKST